MLSLLVPLVLSAAQAVLFPESGKVSGSKFFGYARIEENGKFRAEMIPGIRNEKKAFTVRMTGVTDAVSYDGSGKEIIPEKEAENSGSVELKFPADVRFAALECSRMPEKLEAEFVPAEIPVEAVRVQQVKMKPPRGKKLPVQQVYRIKDKQATLDNGALRLTFSWQKKFQLKSIYSYEAKKNLVSDPDKMRFFVIRINDKDYDIQNCRFQSYKKLNDGIRFVFAVPDNQLTAVLEIRSAGYEFICNLRLLSSTDKVVKFKTVFPCLDGLKLSANTAGDYYLFPSHGGLISNAPCYRREPYGYGSCLFQISDIFSPECGAGFYLRAADPTGLYKHFVIRKSGKTDKRDIALKNWPIGGRINLSMQYFNALRDVPGTTLAIDYIERECRKGKPVVYPSAAIGAHAGDWKKAMEIYAKWSHSVWPRRKEASPVAAVWNLQAGMGASEPLIKYYKSKFPARSDMLEINGYWDVANKNSWGAPLTEAKGWIFKDPATGKLAISFNRGDYDGYNPQWGGLPALREFIAGLKSQGKLVTLYTVPMIGHSETKLAKKYCPQWSIINPDWHFRNKYKDNPLIPKDPPGLLIHYNAYRMCMENPEYADWVVKNLVRLVKETGADGFRMDEFGICGEICLSEMHKHWSGYRKGHPGHQQAVAIMLRQLRNEMDKEVGKEKILMTEFIGSDMLNAPVDGALSWQVTTNDFIANPAPVNLFRFYFPSCKIFEIDEAKKGAASREEWRYWLWNGVGVYNSGQYPAKVWQLLHDNNDAFAFGKAHALVESLDKYIMINRFDAENGKKIYTLLNVSPNTFYGGAMAAESDKEYQELLDNIPLVVKDGKIFLTLRPGKVAVIRETSGK